MMRNLVPSLLAAALAVACTPASLASFSGAGGGANGGDLEGRCAQGYTLFEQSRCQPGQADSAGFGPEFVRHELSEMSRQCKDDASVAKAKALEASCLPAYDGFRARHQARRREVRAKFLAQVSSLLLDPDYPAVADEVRRMLVANEEAGVPRSMDRLPPEAAALCAKHGVDCTYWKELELW